MTEIVLKNVRKTYGTVDVIHGIDLAIGSGEFCVFVGPSGCGKSTLLRLIAGLDSLTSGEVEIDGEVVNGVPASRRGLAMVFQSYALYPHMSVYRNMAFGLENAKVPREEISRRVRDAASLLQISPYLNRRPKALSGGQRQRVAIGRAIVRQPKAFLLDEPLSNLDAELRVTMRKELAALHADIGGTMIYVTHDQVEAMTLADTIVVLQKGRIAQSGPPLELYNHPRNTFVAGFIGSPRMNFFEVHARKSDTGWYLKSECLQVHLPGRNGIIDGARYILGVRPEHISLAGEGDGDAEGKVALTEQLGSETYVHCEVGGRSQVTVQRSGQLPVSTGDRLKLFFVREHLHIFDHTHTAIANGNA